MQAIGKKEPQSNGLTAATKKILVQIPAIFERAWGSLSPAQGRDIKMDT